MKQGLGLSVVMTLLLVISGCTTTSAKDQQALQQGQDSYSQGNYSTAFRQLLPVAKDGDAEAQYVIGYMYYYGKGVVKNPSVAMNWFRLSAKQGNSKAVQALDMVNQSAQTHSGPMMHTQQAPVKAAPKATVASEVTK